MTPTTAQIMTENTVSQTYRATYSPDDNKLRLYASLRLDEETYSLINKAGFRWAPKQELFVAPAWTPGREDVLLSLAGDIEDEDSTLFDRQEQRAGRFSDYSDRRAVESEQALAHVDSLASAVPLGQPILVGHHSERRARRHAQKIESGMKRAVMLFERAEYWEQRAQASLRHAKYKERPDVRYRRIKKIEAELRKSQKHIARSEKYMTMWRAQTLDLKMALLVSNYDHIHACFTLDKYPRPTEKSQYEGSMSLHSALSEEIITFEQARDIAIRCHERTISHQQRWVNHYQNRLAYERAMLNENGGVVTRTEEFEPGGQVLSRGEWLTILRVNRSQGEVSSVETPDLKMALLVSNYDHIHACFTLDKYPRPAEKSQYEGSMSLHSALSEEIITFEQARDIAIRCHERTINHQQRWVNHYQNRLAYERAMLNENGGVVTRTQEFEPGGQVLSRGEWLTILRVNRSKGEVSSVETPGYRFLGYSGTMKLTPDRITDYKAPTAEEASDAKKAAKRPPIVNYPGEGFREMTKAEWAKLPADYKGVRGAAETETHGAYRFRRCMTHGCTLVNVYITDMKTVEIPKK
ncbi:Domain of uncharacterised function (DUF3560) [Klebsiella pneumoniae]|uniref:DUF3560 domain-containing protein n=1 Tax=Klebsiella pneumoniae TaxID=573 RepID=UPI000808DDD6|nr:Domain of uncharacterised function (DUF3560) [Klebsiella pneumoniae]